MTPPAKTRQTLLEAMVPVLAYLLAVAGLWGVYGIAAGIDVVRGDAVRDYIAQHAPLTPQAKQASAQPPATPNQPRKPRQWTPEETQAIEDAARQFTTPEEDAAEIRAFEEAAKHPKTPQGKKAFDDAWIVLMLKLERKRRHETGI